MRRLRTRTAAEDGGVIIEVIVSALLVGMLAVGIFTALDAASARSGSIKSRAIATSVAQADLERMRGMKLVDLSNLRQSRTQTVAGIPFSVTSRADWVNDTSGTASCSSTDNRADYLRITSRITWPAMGGIDPVVLTSVIAPPNGSFGPNQGSLVIRVSDAADQPLQGKVVTLTGPRGMSETTNELGCVMWGYLPVGNYTVSLGGGCADRMGNDPVTKAVGVVGEETTTVQLDCDVPGRIDVRADTVPRDVNNNPQPAEASQLRYVTAAHSGLPAPGFRVFGNGTLVSQIQATSLYPFTSSYAVYAGNCANQDPRVTPNAGTAVLQVVNRGATMGPVTVRQPALNVDVEDPNGSGNPPLPGATVKAYVRTTGCTGTFDMGLTDSTGQLPNPGVPYGLYDVCAEKRNGSNVWYSKTVTGVQVYTPTGNDISQARIRVPQTGNSIERNTRCP